MKTVARKNFVDIIRAVHHLSDLFEAVMEGRDLRDWTTGRRSRSAGAKLYIKLCGYSADAYKQLARSKCLILSSKSEALSNGVSRSVGAWQFLSSPRAFQAPSTTSSGSQPFSACMRRAPEQLAEEMCCFIRTYASDEAFSWVAAENERYFKHHFSEEAVSPLWRDALSGILFNHDPATSSSRP